MGEWGPDGQWRPKEGAAGTRDEVEVSKSKWMSRRRHPGAAVSSAPGRRSRPGPRYRIGGGGGRADGRCAEVKADLKMSAAGMRRSRGGKSRRWATRDDTKITRVQNLAYIHVPTFI